MTNFRLIAVLLAAFGLSACQHGLPQRDSDPSVAKEIGYYQGGKDSKGRNGVGNYVPRVCSNGGWGLPASDCAAPAPMAAAPAAAPAPTKEIKATIAADTDGDGVIDSIDQCPSTKRGAKVNAFGCEANEKISIRLNVNFATASAVVPKTAFEELDRIAAVLKANPNIKMRVEGHTDNAGVKDKNLALSNNRANSVKAYLVKSGANADQLDAQGFGQDQPIAPNTTKDGRAQNRRVVAVVTAQ
jgi:OOP family OmpA-OmpF porin